MCAHGLDVFGFIGCQRTEVDHCGWDVHGVIGVVGRRFPCIVHGNSGGPANLLDEVGVGLAYGAGLRRSPRDVVGEVGLDRAERLGQANTFFTWDVGAAPANSVWELLVGAIGGERRREGCAQPVPFFPPDKIAASTILAS